MSEKYGGQAYRHGGSVNELRDRGVNTGYAGYRMDSNSVRGLNSAVDNGQIRLALEYMKLVANQYQSDIEKLKTDLAEMKSMVMDLARTASAEKRGPGRPPKVATTPESTEGTSDLAE